jgi:hypothetical protein
VRFAINTSESILDLLLFEPFKFPALTVQLRLIAINLALLVGLLDLLALELVADQRAGAQAKGAADRRARARMTHRRANDAAGSGAAQGTDTRALLARR